MVQRSLCFKSRHVQEMLGPREVAGGRWEVGGLIFAGQEGLILLCGIEGFLGPPISQVS